MVPFGDFHIFLRPNSLTRASSGVMVAHFTPTPTSLDRLRRLDRDPVLGRLAVLDAEIEIEEVDVEIGEDQLVLDQAAR